MESLAVSRRSTQVIRTNCDMGSGSGHLLPGTKAKVMKGDGSWAKHGEPGELWFKTPSVALGYANNPEA